MAKVSIIVPVYKVEKYLRCCIESILAQTFTDWELLLVDDGSPDSSGLICDEYAQKDARIRVLHKENGGVSSARNLGLDNICGEYVTFIDADDCLYPKALEVFVMHILKGVDFVQCRYNRIYTEEKYATKPTAQILPPKDYVKSNYFQTCIWGAVLKSSIITAHHIRFDEKVRLGEDQIFLFDYLHFCKRVGHTDAVLYYYRQNEESAVNNPKPEYEVQSVVAFKQLKQRNSLASQQCDNMLFAWFSTLSVSNYLSVRELKELFRDVHLTYCSPKLGLCHKLVWLSLKINLALTIISVRIVSKKNKRK